jgi:uncharacterized protein
MTDFTVDNLIEAAVAGDAAKAAAILNAVPSLLGQANMFGAQAIHAATYAGHPEIVDLLTVDDIEIDGFLAAELGNLRGLARAIKTVPGFVAARDGRGMTALHGACYWGCLDAARLLLAAGADVSAVSQDGFLGIHPLGSAVATTPGVPNPSDDEAMVLALVDLLLDARAEVNARRRDGLTALHTAAYRGQLQVIRRLVARGADLSIEGHVGTGAHAGHTPADMAESQGEVEAARLLRELAVRKMP